MPQAGPLDFPWGEGSNVVNVGRDKLSGMERRPAMALQEGEVYRLFRIESVVSV